MSTPIQQVDVQEILRRNPQLDLDRVRRLEELRTYVQGTKYRLVPVLVGRQSTSQRRTQGMTVSSFLTGSTQA